MKRHLMLLTAGLLAIAGDAAAQYPYPYQSPYGQQQPPSPPVLSPYLNLRNGNFNNAGVNYYNFVRPQMQLQQQQMLYGSSYNPALDPYPLASDINVLPDSRLPRATGLPVTYMNYGSYFNSLGSIGATTRQPQGAGTPTAGASPTTAAPSTGYRR
jgi:hypothetical protein